MKLDLNSQTLNVSFACRIEDAWVPVPETACTQSGFDWTLNGAHYSAQFTPAGDTLCYTLQMDAPNPTQLRMWLAVPGQSDYFHVIPCNIYGDNHAAEAKPGEFPLLTKDPPRGGVLCAAVGIPCGPRRHAARRPLLGRRSGRRCGGTLQRKRGRDHPQRCVCRFAGCVRHQPGVHQRPHHLQKPLHPGAVHPQHGLQGADQRQDLPAQRPANRAA